MSTEKLSTQELSTQEEEEEQGVEQVAAAAEDDMADAHQPVNVVKSLIQKIEEISLNKTDTILEEAENMFKELCGDKESLKETMHDLHCEALNDFNFAERYSMLMGRVSNHLIEGMPVRSQILTFVENDYRMRESIFHSESEKFVNAAMILGNLYDNIRIKGVPLKVLAGPVLEYLNILLKGKEEHHRVFTLQVILNGQKLMKAEDVDDKFMSLKLNIRKAIINMNLEGKSKCWLLLALDYLGNNLKPLSEELRTFYIESLGDDFHYIQSLAERAVTPINIFEEIPPANDVDKLSRGIKNVTIPVKPQSHSFYRHTQYPRDVKRERDVKSSSGQRGTRSDASNYDEGDVYGIQLEKRAE